MSVPEHLRRFPTRDAINSLAKRFGLVNTPDMQDWECEVADPNRLDEFLSAYLNEELSDDELFTLMETIIQSFDESSLDLASSPQWSQVLNLLDDRIDLHAYSVCYWSCLDRDDHDHWWRVTPYMRKVHERHKLKFEGGDSAAKLEDATDRATPDR
ncbi:MAG: hypothetical protein JKY61_07790 [Planctomycetes bacterium]|nr:hypothetical protein [Planctomycetota bacterium]